MFATLLSNWKWEALAVLLLAYSVGVWNVSSSLTSSAYDQERLHDAQEIIRIKTENETRLVIITQGLNKTLDAQAARAKEDRKALLDELSKDSRYSVCLVTDGVRNIYKRKLQAQ